MSAVGNRRREEPREEERTMIVNAQIRPYRCRTRTAGIRHRVAANHSSEMSAPLRRAVVLVLCAAVVLVMACGQFLHWRIMNGSRVAEQLQAVSSDLAVENMNLLARRARLMSPEHVVAMAAVRLDLHEPGKGQVHRL